MDSHGSSFRQLTASARVGSGDGVDLVANGSCASGRWACRTWFVITSVALRAKALRASPRLRRCGSIAPGGDGALASPPNSSFKPNWLRQSA